MVRKDAAFRVVTVLLSWAPTSFVIEHKEDVAFLFCVNLVKALVQEVELEKALGNEVILDALVLEVSVHSLDELQVVQGETNQLVGRLVLVKSDDKWTIEAIVTKKLELLRIVVPRQCLL